MWNVKKKWGVFSGILFTFSVVLSSTFCDIWVADTEKNVLGPYGRRKKMECTG